MSAVLFFTAWLVFLAAAAIPSLLARIGLSPFFAAHPTMPHFFVKTALVAFSFIAMALSGKGWTHFGFVRHDASVRWGRVLLGGGALGALASTLILLTPAAGIPGLREFGLLGLVLSVWIYSSITEEVFIRGWFQSILPRREGGGARRVVLLSGFLFGSMHLSLIWKGADWITVAVIVSTTTLLGFFAASLRDRHGSLLPPIVAHISFNIGGLIAGIVVNIISIATRGEPLV